MSAPLLGRHPARVGGLGRSDGSAALAAVWLPTSGRRGGGDSARRPITLLCSRDLTVALAVPEPRLTSPILSEGGMAAPKATDGDTIMANGSGDCTQPDAYTDPNRPYDEDGPYRIPQDPTRIPPDPIERRLGSTLVTGSSCQPLKSRGTRRGGSRL